jgi:hypothetical protein
MILDTFVELRGSVLLESFSPSSHVSLLPLDIRQKKVSGNTS